MLGIIGAVARLRLGWPLAHYVVLRDTILAIAAHVLKRGAARRCIFEPLLIIGVDRAALVRLFPGALFAAAELRRLARWTIASARRAGKRYSRAIGARA